MIPKIRVGILMHGIFYGGASRSLIQLLKILKNEERFEFIVYTTSISSLKVKKELEKYCVSIKKVKLKIITANQASVSSIKTFKKSKNVGLINFINQLKHDEINLLHINTTVFSHILKPITDLTNIKIIVHVRELLPEYGKTLIGDYIIEQIKFYSDFIICISENEAERFADYERKVILPNPIDFNEIDSTIGNFRAQNNINKETIIITMSSHFYKPKGHILFLDALKILLEKYNLKNILFLIVGYKQHNLFLRKYIKKILMMSDYLSEIKNKIKNEGLTNFVKLIPYTYDIYEIIKDSDIIVRPALTADPWGRDVIEGMAMKKPIVATGNSTFFIKPEITGYLVSPNANELANKIKDLIKDKSKRELFGLNGRKTIENICNSINYSKQLINIYDTISE